MGSKLLSIGAAILGIAGTYAYYTGVDSVINITPEIFQQFNPFFIIILTPISVAFFSSLNAKELNHRHHVKLVSVCSLQQWDLL